MVKRKIAFVTGGAGFIGSNLIRQLLKGGYKVNILLKPETDKWRIKDITSGLTVYTEDLYHVGKLKSLIERLNPTVIYHLAAYGRSASEVDSQEMIRTNILGTHNLLTASKDVAYDAFINTGSSVEYGHKSQSMRETDSCNPDSFYGITKLAATHMCQIFAREFKKPILTVRPFSVYGPYEDEGRLIPSIIAAVLQKEPIQLTPKVIRHDYIYVNDLIDALVKIAQLGNKLGSQIINLGTGREYTNSEVVAILFRIMQQKVPVVTGGYKGRSWDSAHWVADTSLAKELLNWSSTTTLTQGLTKTVAWVKENSS